MPRILGVSAPQAQEAYGLVAVCVGLSIVSHSSIDVPVARTLNLERLVCGSEGEVGVKGWLRRALPGASGESERS